MTQDELWKLEFELRCKMIEACDEYIAKNGVQLTNYEYYRAVCNASVSVAALYGIFSELSTRQVFLENCGIVYENCLAAVAGKKVDDIVRQAAKEPT